MLVEQVELYDMDYCTYKIFTHQTRQAVSWLSFPSFECSGTTCFTRVDNAISACKINISFKVTQLS